MTPHHRGSFLVALLVSLLPSACRKQETQTLLPTAVPAPAVTASPTPLPVATLYAWANPLAAGLADHTWVTSFPAASPCPPGKSYWYSWGGCHETGPTSTARPLVSHAADLDVARCIATPDLDEYLPPTSPAHGGINLYGVDGVCHQLANRILWAATKGASDPPTVEDAKGYAVSRWLYGTYGVNAAEWQARIAHCTAPAAAGPAAAPGTPAAMAMMKVAVPVSHEADLRAMIRERLGPQVSNVKAERLGSIRQNVVVSKKLLDRRVQAGQLSPRQFADSVNAMVAQSMRQAAETLTPEEYQKLFGLPPGETIRVVDPAIAEKSRYRVE